MDFLTEGIVIAVIASLVSPAILKLVEFSFSKSSEKARKEEQEKIEMRAKIEALAKRVDELRQQNTEQMIRIGVQQTTIEAQSKEIATLRTEVQDRDKRIDELETQVRTLTGKRGSKR